MTEDMQEEAQDRRCRIIEGARAAFLRFGFQRTRLTDIATAAGVSRTALYHYFPGKEEVFKAVVDDLHAASLALAQRALEEASTLEEALTGLFEARFGRLIGALAASPHGAELAEARHDLTAAAAREADDAFQAMVISALSHHGRDRDAEAFADMLIAAVKGLMRSGDTYAFKTTFDDRLQRLIGCVVH